MAIANLQELIEAGVHFGSQTSRWDPRMKQYIHSRRDKIYIIDLRETLKGLIRAYHFLSQVSAKGKNVLFVGTKRPAAEVVRQEAQRVSAHFVSTRWLGGTLTNLQTMRNRVNRLEELESLEKTGAISEFSKKMISSLTRERKKIFRNFEGTRDMKELPGAVVIVDPRNEHIAIAETLKLGLPIVALADTDCNPQPIDFLIPGNDDSIRSIQCIVSKLADAVAFGRKKASEQAVFAGANKAAGAARPAPERAAPAAPKTETPAPNNLPDDFSKVGGFSFGGDE